MSTTLCWYEFFAGGGMARLGLGERWTCVFANEWCPKKASAYIERFGRGNPKQCPELKVGDVAKLTTADLPARADLVWASFPCQDLSLAGAGAGLSGNRSGTFKPFWKLITGLSAEARAPRIVVLENVAGAITSHDGKDFTSIMDSLATAGYRAGAMIIDAIRFLPQSRPRLFIVGIQNDVAVTQNLAGPFPATVWHPKSIQEAYLRLPGRLQNNWLWWRLPEPPPAVMGLSDIVEEDPAGVKWHSREQTGKLLAMMSLLNRQKLREIQAGGGRRIGTVYRRTRPDGNGGKVQRAEGRFDDVSGCLRTPAGGSSRQIVLVVEGKSVRSRLLSVREAAKLMGVDPDSYPVPKNYNEAYHLFGDGLAVPAVAWLAECLLTPLAVSIAERVAA